MLTCTGMSLLHWFEHMPGLVTNHIRKPMSAGAKGKEVPSLSCISGLENFSHALHFSIPKTTLFSNNTERWNFDVHSVGRHVHTAVSLYGWRDGWRPKASQGRPRKGRRQAQAIR